MRSRRTLILSGFAAFTLAACQTASDVTDSVVTAVTGDRDVVDIASNDPRFSTLAAAINAAGLADTLKGEGPFTVFAPTNDAFDALPPGTLADLLKPENQESLQSILTYHVLGEKVLSTDVSGFMFPTTLQGSTVSVTASDGVMVNSSKVIDADIGASNGVIHAIDKVLIPTN